MAAVTRTLPPDIASFTGREPELRALMGAAGSGPVAGLHAIGGMPGVGKTALAVHVAHLLRDRFPERQLFIDLHAHTPGQDPVSPPAALAGLLTEIGVDARYLPDSLEGRTNLWRDRMAGQRALLILDNAASSAQVTPLLPGGEDCLVLVTSRRHLGDLPGAIIPLRLNVLPPDEAKTMFLKLAPGAATDPVAAVEELARLARYLPLAISLLARVFARHPSWTLADLTRETRASLLTLAAEKDSVAAAFEVSYRYLAPGLQRFFRRLGQHPGATIEAYAAAALAGISLQEAVGYLDSLHGEGILTEAGYRRYGMHDLIRSDACDRAAADPERGLERLLDYYQHTAAITQSLLARQTRARLDPAVLTSPPTAVPVLPDRTRALCWARDERANLLACLDHVTDTGQHARVVALTAAIAALLRQDGPWTGAITRHATAVQAARQLGDRRGEANALNDLGDVRYLAGEYPGAAEAHQKALGIYRDLGDRQGQANALTYLGVVRQHTGDYPGAAGALEEALGICRDLGDRLGQANALIYVGAVRQQTGDYPGAAEVLEEALGSYRDLGNPQGQANALTYLGAVWRLTGDYRNAAQAQEEALGLYRDLGDRLGQANTLIYLGFVRQHTGDYRGAAEVLEQALRICRDLGQRQGQANALTYLGAGRRQTGDYAGGAGALEEALGIYRDLGDRGGEAEALNEVGTVHRVRGDLDRAGASHRRALDLAREIESGWDEAHAQAGLGRCALAAGSIADARVGLRQAREIFQRIGAAEAAGVTAELDALARSGLPGDGGHRDSPGE
jgi:tetratricopeptide (TPR) repeat protein